MGKGSIFARCTARTVPAIKQVRWRQGCRRRKHNNCVLDADFVPPRDFLLKTIPYFADEKLAFVQTRWGHINRDYSLLTFLQALAIDAHFVVEQFARWHEPVLVQL